MPALNLPAVLAGTRVSPMDQVNMNRAFPGDPRGTPTLMIPGRPPPHPAAVRCA